MVVIKDRWVLRKCALGPVIKEKVYRLALHLPVLAVFLELT